MDIISAVANLQKERDYYRDAVKECQGVIKQLLEGPGEFEYIHPMDLGELLSAKTGITDVYKVGDNTFELPRLEKKYKQSIWIPARLPRTIE